MFVDKTDDPRLPVQTLSVVNTDVGELDGSARAIAIELSVAGKGTFVAYGIDLADGDFVVTSVGSIPAAALKKASEITDLWMKGNFSVPFFDEMADAR